MSEKRKFSVVFDENEFDLETIMTLFKNKNRKVRNIFNEEVDYPWRNQKLDPKKEKEKKTARIAEENRNREEKLRRDEEERKLISILKMSETKKREREIALNREAQERLEAAENLLLLSKEFVEFDSELIADSDDEEEEEEMPIISISDESSDYEEQTH